MIKKHPFVICLLGLCLLFSQSAFAQTDTAAEEETAASKIEKYEFTIEKSLEHTEIKSQDQTGTCWCFATGSFIESELIRQGKGKHELSEMFIVKNVYKEKAFNFIQRQGKANFSEGALAHDLISAAGKYGVVPDEIYTGLLDNNQQHNHGEMAAILEAMLKAYTSQGKPGTHWDEAFAAVLDTYLGTSPSQFSYRENDYTPQSFARSLGFNGDDYVNITSFSHHPFGRPFVLEIPDNFSNGSFQNVPIDDLVATIDAALDGGYTVAWDGDVSERGFASGNGLAVLPTPDRDNGMEVPGTEIEVTQEMRQSTFEDQTTTDDHLMHLVGRAHDQLGNKYYIIKNSWGPSAGPYNGYLYMSEAYVRLKTMAILVHKDAPLATATPAEPTAANKEAVVSPGGKQ